MEFSDLNHMKKQVFKSSRMIGDATSNYILFTLSSNVYHHHFKMSMDISVFYPAP